jgi:VIT1/CCC1 family predicted Fe2+/Mn2+ transporter
MPSHTEHHLVSRSGWLRAALLGANDGIISTSSIVLGVAAAGATSQSIMVAGVASLVAGALSMAAGEYVSVSSQADTEAADLAKEQSELIRNPEGETKELAHIYVERGLDPKLARQVAEQLMAKDALGAHARDEIGITEVLVARPIQAALSSAASFAAGAIIPVGLALVSPPDKASLIIAGGSLIALFALGLLGAKLGGAGLWRPAFRVAFWGAAAMAITAAIGALTGTAL